MDYPFKVVILQQIRKDTPSDLLSYLRGVQLPKQNPKCANERNTLAFESALEGTSNPEIVTDNGQHFL